MPVRDNHETRHPARDTSDLFGCHRLDALADDGRSALICQVSICGSAATYSAVLIDDSRRLVVTEAEIVAPSAGWELRASGLWAEQVCETPLDHWSYGLEAFGLDLDDPAALLGRGYGHREPLGWELEFEAGETAVWADESKSGYSQSGQVHGLILDADGEHDFVGTARRTHWWAGLGPTQLEVGSVKTDSSDTRGVLNQVWIPDVMTAVVNPALSVWLTVLCEGVVGSERLTPPIGDLNA